MADSPARKRVTFRADESGQATIVVAAAILVLLGALALGTEWGFALTQRRLAQNAADAAALAGARLMASNVRNTDSGPVYIVTEHAVYCRAHELFSSNLVSFRPSSPLDDLTVEWSAANASGAASGWSAVSAPSGSLPNHGCPTTPGTIVTTGTAMNRTAVFLRASPTITYSSPLASLAGQSSLTASAHAVARIVGTGIPVGAQSWPMVRHFNAADFAGGRCDPPCPTNPSQIQPVTFWSTGNEPEMTYNDFMGLVDFSRYSPSANVYNGRPACTGSPTAACVPQLIRAWDQSGPAPNGKDDLVHVFSGGTPCSPPAPSLRWLTGGLEDPQNADKQCSIMNWIAWGFGGEQGDGDNGPRGELSLEGDWRSPGPSSFQERPSNIPNAGGRGVCASVPDPLPSPSCADSWKGDWVEAAHTGNVGSNVARALRYFIDQHGVSDVLSNTRTGPGVGSPLYGNKVVIIVYLWDCAESFTGTPSGNNQWSLITPRRGGTDCSDIHDGNDIGSVQLGRVHLFSYAPFTFYRGLVDGSSIRGFWGGLVTSDPGQCRFNPTLPGCQINPFANAVFLVADD